MKVVLAVGRALLADVAGICLDDVLEVTVLVGIELDRTIKK